MKVLVTGGTGFTRRNVVDLLMENRHSVRLFSRMAGILNGWWKRRIVFPRRFRGSLIDPARLTGSDVLYNIVEIRNIPYRSRKKCEAMESIVGHLGTADLKRIVFVSSLTVAGMPAAGPATGKDRLCLRAQGPYTWYKQQRKKLLTERRTCPFLGERHSVTCTGSRNTRWHGG